MKPSIDRFQLSSYRYILAGVGISLCYWLIESVTHAAYFSESGLFSQLFPAFPPEIWARSTAILLILLLSGYLQLYIDRRHNKARLEQSETLLAEKATDEKFILENTSSLTAVLDKDGRYLYINPIHKKMAAVLRESEQRYQAMFDNIHSAVAVYRAVDDGQDFVIIDFNRAAEQIEKIPRPEVIEKKVTEVFPGINKVGLLDVFQRVYQTGRAEHYPTSWYQDDRIAGWRKNYVYKLPSGEVVAVYSDELERIKAEEALKESEARFRSLVESSTDHIFMLNREGKYLFTNGRSTHLNPASGSSLVGLTLGDVYPPDLADHYRQQIENVFEKGGTTSFEHELETAGDDRHVHIDTIFPVYKDKKIIAVGGICRDITQRKKYEKELQHKTRELETALISLRQAQRQFVDQERQRALSQMASGIAHDFNNALASIQGFSDLLLQTPEDLNDAETVKRYVTMINTSARDAAQIVRRLRKFYRPSDEEAIASINISALAEEVIALTEPVWKHSARAKGAAIHVEKTLDHQLTVHGNPAELHEALVNLIFNAVDAMPEGGTLGFCTRREEDRALLAISDTGIGMDTIVQKRCLDPFYTTKGESGSGLGLATVQGIITRHSGQIDIASAPNRGSIFLIRLPLSMPEESSSLSEEETLFEHTCLKILVVDDEKDQRLLLTKYLQKKNHRVDTANNGLEGIQKFNDGWYDLIITDRAMPKLNGDALARNIKAIASSKPIIMLTGFGDMMEAANEKPDAVDLLLSKPVTLKSLGSAIEQVMPDRHAG